MSFNNIVISENRIFNCYSNELVWNSCVQKTFRFIIWVNEIGDWMIFAEKITPFYKILLPFVHFSLMHRPGILTWYAGCIRCHFFCGFNTDYCVACGRFRCYGLKRIVARVENMVHVITATQIFWDFWTVYVFDRG